MLNNIKIFLTTIYIENKSIIIVNNNYNIRLIFDYITIYVQTLNIDTTASSQLGNIILNR